MFTLHLEPWFDRAEWNHVRDLVLARDPTALQFMKVWRSRSARLPAGVETTVSLLEASSNMDNSLALSMSINRFLNHVSHIGMNEFGVSKLHAAADRLQVPGWIVDIRHETTHGHMPSITILRSGFEVCWSWICANYWENKMNPVLPLKDKERDALENLLECYLYLRVYQCWGTMYVKDIAENGDVFTHIKSLWGNCVRQKKTKDFLSLSVKQAAAITKNEILNLQTEKEELARILVDEELLVPEDSFLQSLVGEEEDDHVEVPKDLLFVWKDYIELIDESVGAKLLIDLLVEKIGRNDVEENHKEYCAAWIVEISEGILARSKHLTLKKDHGAGIKDFERWISKPNRLIQMLLPCFSSLIGLGRRKQSLIDDLMTAAVGDSEEQDGNSSVEKVFSVEDIASEAEEAAKPTLGWRPVTSSGWDQQILRTFHDQSWESLWLGETAEWLPSPRQPEEEEEFQLSVRHSMQVVWPGEEVLPQGRAEEDKPFFYRDVSQNLNQFSSPRRKRVRKN